MPPEDIPIAPGSTGSLLGIAGCNRAATSTRPRWQRPTGSGIVTGRGPGHPVTADPHLGDRPLPGDSVGLLEGLTTTRAIRRYRREPVPLDALRAILFAASSAPS